MLGSIAATCFRRRRLVVLAWVLALVGFTVASSVGAGDWKTSARLEGTDSQRAYDLLAAEFPSQAVRWWRLPISSRPIAARHRRSSNQGRISLAPAGATTARSCLPSAIRAPA